MKPAIKSLSDEELLAKAHNEAMFDQAEKETAMKLNTYNLDADAVEQLRQEFQQRLDDMHAKSHTAWIDRVAIIYDKFRTELNYGPSRADSIRVLKELIHEQLKQHFVEGLLDELVQAAGDYAYSYEEATEAMLETLSLAFENDMKCE